MILTSGVAISAATASAVHRKFNQLRIYLLFSFFEYVYQIFCLTSVLWREEGVTRSRVSRTASSADPMDIVFRRGRII